MDDATSEGRLVDSLGKRLFTARLELIAELDRFSLGRVPAIEAMALGSCPSSPSGRP
jgi:hypothetical protein